MANNVFGIDLGTCNIKIYSKSEDGILVEKNMIAIENKNTLFAYGNSAYEMYEKAPANIHISYPLSNGVIADIKNMELLVKYFVGDLSKGGLKPSDFYIAVPTDVTEVEKRAFYDLIRDAGGIVLSKLIKVGGLKFDDAIRTAIRKEFSLIIGGKTAESVKISLSELKESSSNAVVYGRDIVTGLPVEREIPVSLVDEALAEHFHTIIDNIKVILERTPPELAADIYRHGIYLTGGASQVSYLAQRIQKGTGLHVNMAENPVTSVALGLAKIIKEDNYKSVAYAIEGMSK